MLGAEVKDVSEEEADPLNHVVLRGRVSVAPTQRELPSGTSILAFRVTVPRVATHMTNGSKQTSDWVDCVAWAPRPKRSVRSWAVGDCVEVEGSLRRRWIGGGGTVPNTLVEIEVLKGRVVARAG